MTLPDLTLGLFLLFCRIGGCLMIMPGFSSPRVPVRIRLAAAIGVTLSLAPLLLARIPVSLHRGTEAALVLAILRESLIGGSIGILARMIFAALETLCVAAANAAGYGGVFGTRVDESDTLPELASFVMFVATTLFFVTDQHAEIVRALAASYDVLGLGDAQEARLSLAHVTDALGRAFPLALRITSPFVLYGLLVNFAVGLLNRLTPQIPVFFISTPFVIAGGLALLYAVGGTLLALFIDGFHGWWSRG